MDFTEDTVVGLTALEQRQQTLAHMVRMVARKVSHACSCYGSAGGLGKSSTILRTLDEEGVTPILVNSHITPLALYGTMFQHAGRQIIFFDDVDSMFSSMATPRPAAVCPVGFAQDRDLRQFANCPVTCRRLSSSRAAASSPLTSSR